MGINRPRVRCAILWFLGYLWTAAAVLAISNVLNWQYDSGFEWWLVAAYSFLALGLASPAFSLAGDTELGSIYSLAVLIALTVASAVALRRSGTKARGS